MANVNIKFNGKDFLLSCDDGQEEHLEELSIHLNKKFNDKTGCPIIVNTSFNVRGEPIVCTPQDAYRCFMRTEMDVLVLQNQILFKSDQDQIEKDEQWKQEFALD